LSDPTLEKAQASTLALGEIERHWWVKPKPITDAVVVLPVP
jgi:hypothetical protein